MFIKKINMKEYKRFKDLTIDLGDNPKRLIALVGPNGCGKSSVFDSMLFLANSYDHIGNTYTYGTNRDYHYHSLMRDPGYNFQNILLEFMDGDFYSIYSQKREQGRQKTIFSFRSSFRYNSNLKIDQVNSVKDMAQNSYGASCASDLDQRIEEDYRRLFAKYNKYRDDNDVKPSEARKVIIGELNEALKKCLDLEIVELGNIEDDKGTLFFKKSDSDMEFDYNVLSAGEKEVIDILLDLYLRKETYNDSIYLIDEPELHLNTAIQRALLIEINKMVPKNCQIWVATHSIGFLRALQDELKQETQIIEFKKENKWAAEKYILKPAELSRADWKNIFSTALDDLTNLICPRTIIYCEGKDKPGRDNKENGLDACVYNSIFSKNYPETVFVSSGGNTELDQRSEIAMAILSKVFSELEILVLKDRDMISNRCANDEDRLEYLSKHPKNHRVLERFELENYLYDKEVLKEYCKNNELEFDELEYDKNFKDIKNDNVKDKTGIIKKCCNINYSIKQELFKKDLAKCINEKMNIYKELEEVIFNN